MLFVLQSPNASCPSRWSTIILVDPSVWVSPRCHEAPIARLHLENPVPLISWRKSGEWYQMPPRNRKNRCCSHFYQRHERFEKLKVESTSYSQHLDEQLQLYQPISKRWARETIIPMSPMISLPRLGERLLSHLNDNQPQQH